MSLQDSQTWNFNTTLSNILDTLLGKFEVTPSFNVGTVKVELPKQIILYVLLGFVVLYFMLKR